MKKVYNYRSKIVHGSDLKDKEQYFEFNKTKRAVWDIAVEFLRCTLMFVTMHQEYLDSTKFDEYIDKVLLAKETEECRKRTEA